MLILASFNIVSVHIIPVTSVSGVENVGAAQPRAVKGEETHPPAVRPQQVVQG